MNIIRKFLLRILFRYIYKSSIIPSDFEKRNNLFGENPEITIYHSRFLKLYIYECVTIAHQRAIYILDDAGGVINLSSSFHLDLIINLPYLFRPRIDVTQICAIGRNIPPNNYYHFYMECLLPFLCIRKEFPGILLTFNYHLDIPYKIFLNLIGINYLDGDTDKKFNKVIDLPSISGGILSPSLSYAIEQLNQLQASILKPPKIYSDKIFINRKTGLRSLDRDISSMLTRFGFVEYFCEEYSIADQANIFGRAKYIIGLHGAGLTNIIFNTNPNLFEIIPSDPWGGPDGYGNGCFKNLCESLNGDYRRIVGSQLLNGEFSIDQNIFELCVIEWLNDSPKNLCI